MRRPSHHADVVRIGVELARSAEAIRALRELHQHAGLGPPVAGIRSYARKHALQHVAALRVAEIHEQLARRRELLHARPGMLPVPVLTVAGAATRLENPWTNYLGAVLRLSSAAGHLPLARAFVAAVLKVHPDELPSDGRDFVVTEADLGQVPCTCGHSCSLDLAVVCGGYAVAVEQKVRAGASNWKCEGPCGGHQLRNYRQLFAPEPARESSWVSRRAPGHRPKFVYLKPVEDQSVEDWDGFSHASLAEALAPSIRELGGTADRWSAATLVVDLASSVGGDMGRAIGAFERWLGNPYDAAAAIDLRSRLEHDRVLLHLLEALYGN